MRFLNLVQVAIKKYQLFHTKLLYLQDPNIKLLPIVPIGWLDGYSDIPTHYNVTYFDSSEVTRSWLSPENIKPFGPNKKFHTRLPKDKKTKTRMVAAIAQAEDAEKLPLATRLAKYNFVSRYSGPINPPRKIYNNELLKFKNKLKREYNISFSDDSGEDSDDVIVEVPVENNATTVIKRGGNVLLVGSPKTVKKDIKNKVPKKPRLIGKDTVNAMFTDKTAADCSVPEKPIRVKNEEDLIHGEYSVGSLVWARLTGWPWWPAMVDDHPDTEQYCGWLDGYSDIPTHYNVTYFDSSEVTRSWLSPENIKPFGPNKKFHTRLPKDKKTKTRMVAAIAQAEDAEKLPLATRLAKYNFVSRYSGPINPPRKIYNNELLKFKNKLKREYNISFSDDSGEDSDDVIVEVPVENNATTVIKRGGNVLLVGSPKTVKKDIKNKVPKKPRLIGKDTVNAMFTDKTAADCSVPEKPIRVKDEEDLIHGEYSVGSLVWARLTGWPWWPAMVDDHPDTEQYCGWLDGYSDIPTHYNVTYFDSSEVTRSWLSPENIKPFGPNKKFHTRLPKDKKTKTRMVAAIAQAEDAEKLPLATRLAKYNFVSRYSGPINPPRKIYNNELLKFKNKLKREYNISFSDDSGEDSDDVIVDVPVENNATTVIKRGGNVLLVGSPKTVKKDIKNKVPKKPRLIEKDTVNAMFTDKTAADCSVPEKPIRVKDEEDLIHGEYSVGSLVWARLTGWPWWPAMVDDHPDTEQYCGWLDGYSDIPTHYNVTYFDSSEVTRSWLSPENIKPFGPNKKFHTRLPKDKKTKTRMVAAIAQAEDAEKLPLATRLAKYNFVSRYSGPINPPRKIYNNELLKFKNKLKREYNISFSDDSGEDSDDVIVEVPVENNATTVIKRGGNVLLVGSPKTVKKDIKNKVPKKPRLIEHQDTAPTKTNTAESERNEDLEQSASMAVQVDSFVSSTVCDEQLSQKQNEEADFTNELNNNTSTLPASPKSNDFDF